MSFLPLEIRPEQGFIDLKNELNEEFFAHAKINNMVSCIYYPQSKKPIYGHFKLEVEGRAWTLIDHDFKGEMIACAQGVDYTPQHTGLNDYDVVPITKLIRSSSENGLPFIRYHITVSPSQLSELRENIGKDKSVSCSRGVLKTLSKYGQFTVPLPFTFTPLTASIYLSTASGLGASRINKVEFVRNKSLSKSIAKCMPAVVIEILVVAFIIHNIYTRCVF
ncbi:MAG: hypothetical protein VX777_00935 [Chlamydiota bacterium]|nr:hypothetical protein [Chlamydiota bacterium]